MQDRLLGRHLLYPDDTTPRSYDAFTRPLESRIMGAALKMVAFIFPSTVKERVWFGRLA